MNIDFITEMLSKIGEKITLYETEKERKEKGLNISPSDYYLIRNMELFITKKD